MNEIEKLELVNEFKLARNRLVLLDYDGTLVNYNKIPADATLTAETIEILARLISKPDLRIYIITGRGCKDIETLLQNLPLGIIAEHGAMIKENNSWKKYLSYNNQWKKPVINLMEQAVMECHGSMVEEKQFSVAWHYRNVDDNVAYIHSRKLLRLIHETANSLNLKIHDGNKVIEVMPSNNGKGIAVKRLLEKNKYDFMLSIGDDVTDEEMFEYSSNHVNSCTIKVGNGNTYAKCRLECVEEVIMLLNHLGA